MKTRLRIIRYVLIHILLWIAVWFFYVYFFSYNSDDRAYVMWFSSLLLPLAAAVTYFTVYYLIPRYLLQKKYRQFILYSFYTFVFSSYIIALIIYGCLIFLLDLNINAMPPMSKNFFFILILLYLVVGIVSSISILNHNLTTSSRNKELQNKILATQLQMKDQELHYLKSQIHPHFLFNTLNTIYGLSIKQSKQTPETILRLSNLLDYILYQVSKPRVRLKEEVQHIREYIELEKIRFEDSLRVVFRSDNIPDETGIAPMLLIPLVENAFKHGSIINGYLSIDVTISLNEERMDFSVSNTFIGESSENKEGGLGIENILKRLEFHYRDNYKLEKEIKDKRYNACLSIFNINKISHA
ncbi:MAG: histidine kinase [Bacteroidales bacterium]|nr:histidine kinase [Bacteroidales bacterium]